MINMSSKKRETDLSDLSEKTHKQYCASHQINPTNPFPLFFLRQNHKGICLDEKIISANQNQFLHNRGLQAHGHRFHNG